MKEGEALGNASGPVAFIGALRAISEIKLLNQITPSNSRNGKDNNKTKNSSKNGRTGHQRGLVRLPLVGVERQNNDSKKGDPAEDATLPPPGSFFVEKMLGATPFKPRSRCCPSSPGSPFQLPPPPGIAMEGGP